MPTLYHSRGFIDTLHNQPAPGPDSGTLIKCAFFSLGVAETATQRLSHPAPPAGLDWAGPKGTRAFASYCTPENTGKPLVFVAIFARARKTTRLKPMP